MPLPRQKSKGRRNRDQRYGNALLRRRGLTAFRQLRDCAQGDSAGRKRDQHDLENCRQRFGLAVPEAVVLVCRV